MIYIQACLMLFAATCGEALAGGFGIEQSTYYQGMSFAGAAGGGVTLSSLSWNPATANFAGANLTFESSNSVILMSADRYKPWRPARDGPGRNRDGPQRPHRR
jgi:hypothetical protein